MNTEFPAIFLLQFLWMRCAYTPFWRDAYGVCARACVRMSMCNGYHTRMTLCDTLYRVWIITKLWNQQLQRFFFCSFVFRLVYDDQFFLPARNNKHDLNIELMGIGSVYLGNTFISACTTPNGNWTVCTMQSTTPHNVDGTVHTAAYHMLRTGYFSMGFINEWCAVIHTVSNVNHFEIESNVNWW